MEHIAGLNLKDLLPGSREMYKLNIVQNALGDYWQVPVMVAKGSADGPVLGVTAALHGNELNGVSIIHQLWKHIDPSQLRGTLVLVPVLNIPGFLNGQREFSDGRDLNRLMPGKESGATSEVYAHAIVNKILCHFTHLIDLHTASFGRINSLYVRADMTNDKVARMAELQEPQIIVNKSGEEGTLRHQAAIMGIPAITVEAGDPHIFQRKHIRPSIFGLRNVMIDLGMISESKQEISHDAVFCKKSFWLYANAGGILQVYPNLTDVIAENEPIAKVTDIYGRPVDEILSPCRAVVVAKSTNPVCEMGSRVIHLGIIWDDYDH